MAFCVPFDGCQAFLGHRTPRSNGCRLGPKNHPALGFDHDGKSQGAGIAAPFIGLELVELKLRPCRQLPLKVEVEPAQVAADLTRLQFGAVPAEMDLAA